MNAGACKLCVLKCEREGKRLDCGRRAPDLERPHRVGDPGSRPAAASPGAHRLALLDLSGFLVLNCGIQKTKPEKAGATLGLWVRRYLRLYNGQPAALELMAQPYGPSALRTDSGRI